MLSFMEILINSLSVLTICCMILFVWQKRGSTASRELIILSLFMLEWAIGSFVEEAVVGINLKIVWRNITQFGVFYTPAAVLFFTIAYSGIMQQYQRKIQRVIYSVQTFGILFIWTDQWHHLARTNIYLLDNSLVIVPSVWDMVLISFNFLYMATSIIIIISFAFLTVKSMRKQVICVAVGMLIIVFYSLIKVSTNGLFGISIPISGIFALGVVFMLLGIKRYDLTMITPIARNEAINIMNEGIIILSADGKVADVNPAARHIFHPNGAAESEDNSLTRFEECLKRDFPEWYDAILHKKEQCFPITIDSLDGKKYFLCESYAVKNKKNKVIGSLSVIKDITEQKRNTEQLRLAAETDGLTGIYNRATFIQRVEALLQEYSGEVCLIFLDVDFFKQINDQHGHAAGDFILRELCSYIRLQLSDDIIFGRMGGEEFAIFIKVQNPRLPSQLAEKLRNGIEQRQFLFHDVVIKITLSAGLAYGSYDDFNRLYNIADTNLYKAKQSGRNCVCS